MDARDLRLLYEHRIAAVVDLAVNEPPAQFAREMMYFRIPINDGGGNSNAVIETAIRCVVVLIETRFRTLVACSAGMSRSPAIAAAALAIATRTSAEQCLAAIVANAPHDVSPILWSQVNTVCTQILRHED